MMKPEPSALECCCGPPNSSNGPCECGSSGPPCGESSGDCCPPSSGSSGSSVEMFTTAGLSLAARSTKSGIVCAFGACAGSASSVQKCAGAGGVESAARTSRPSAIKMNVATKSATPEPAIGRNNLFVMCDLSEDGRSTARRSRQFNVLHLQTGKNLFEHRLLVGVEIPPRLVTQHYDYVDHLLSHRQVAHYLAAHRVRHFAQRRQRLLRQAE